MTTFCTKAAAALAFFTAGYVARARDENGIVCFLGLLAGAAAMVLL